MFAALGVATADGVYALIAVYASAPLAPALRSAALSLRQGSAVVLILLAVCGATTAIRRHRQPQDEAAAVPGAPGLARAYLGMWGMTMLNPLTMVYFTALVLGQQPTTAPGRTDQAMFILAVFLASASWQLALAGSGAILGRVLTGSRGRLITAIASSTLIGGLALHLLIAAS